MVQWCYLALREIVRIGIAGAIGVILFKHLNPGPAAGLTVGVLWLLSEPWIARESPGLSRILLTEAGIYIMDEGLYCDWQDVAFHARVGDVIVFEPSREAAPPRLFGRRRRSVPLGRKSRTEVAELFASRAGKPV